MDSNEDESLDERPAEVYDESVLKDRFKFWLTNLATSCRRPQVNGPLPELQLYKCSALEMSVNHRGSGSGESSQGFPADQSKTQPVIKAQLLPEVQFSKCVSEMLPVVQQAYAMLDVAPHAQGHSNEAVATQAQGQAQGHQNEAVDIQNEGRLINVSQPCRQSSAAVATLAGAHALRHDAETQTSIIFEGWKEAPDDSTTVISNLPDVIYSSSESSAQSLPTSPDVLSNGAFKEHEAAAIDCERASKQFCLEADNLAAGSSDAGLQENSSFASVIGLQPDSQRSDAEIEMERQASSGYATQLSRQSGNSLSTSCDDGSSIFSQPESAKDSSLDSSVMFFVAGAAPSLENLSSSETVISWKHPSHNCSTTSCLENLPDFDQLLSDDELKSTTSDRSVRDLLAEASGILGMVVENEDENVAVRPVLHSLSEDVFSLEMMNQELADYAFQLINEGLTPVEVEQNLFEHLNQLPAQDSPAEDEDASMGISSWSEEVQQNCIENLQIAAACGDKACDSDRCLFFQELLTDLEDHLRNRTLLNSRLHLELLRSIAEHSAVCSEIHCTLPWCLFFHLSDLDEPEEQISRLLILNSAFDFGVTREIKVTPLDTVEFIQLDASTEWPSIQSKSKSVPENDSDFEFLAPSTQFGRISFYALSLGIVPKLLHIKLQSAIDDVHVWRRLRGLQHPNIVHLLWVYVSHSRAVICSDALTYGDKSLEDVMKERRTGLPLAEFVRFTASILSATEYLHGNQILYLLWTADSVGLMVDGLTVRLRDFSCAVDESRATSDDGELADLLSSALPPVIVSPEMFQNDIGRHSDVWGIGCLMFHLAHGFTVHHDLRHCRLDDIRTKVKQLPLPAILRSAQNIPVRNILSQVFVEKCQRLQIEELREQVLQLQAS